MQPLLTHGLGRRLALLAVPLALLAGCGELTGTAAPRLDASGASVRGTYAVTDKNIAEVRLRANETINNSRSASGLGPVRLDDALVRAADMHSRSMSEQGRAWHFGSDGSSPFDRASRAGFRGKLIGEIVSETYESEVRTIATWMGSPEQRSLILDPKAQSMGIGVFQDATSKLWWTLSIGE